MQLSLVCLVLLFFCIPGLNWLASVSHVWGRGKTELLQMMLRVAGHALSSVVQSDQSCLDTDNLILALLLHACQQQLLRCDCSISELSACLVGSRWVEGEKKVKLGCLLRIYRNFPNSRIAWNPRKCTVSVVLSLQLSSPWSSGDMPVKSHPPAILDLCCRFPRVYCR